MKELKFNQNGKFRILQISDMQDTKATSVDTLKFLKAAISETKPDLIVLTGDQLDVFGLWGKGEILKKNVRKALEGIMAPIRASGIPFLVTFGNHDRQTGVSNEEQAKIYAEMENCICFDSDDDRPDTGTFNQIIMSSDGSKPAMNIYMIDSNSSHPDEMNGYDIVHPEQLEWYKNKSEQLKKENNGNAVPSILFQHIPVWEIYDILKEVPKGTADSLPAFRSRKGKFFTLDDEKIWYEGTFGETPSVPEVPCDEFETVKNQGDVFAMFFGHDHYNSFIGKLDGIDLGYCPGAGYNTYGLSPRGMRVFDFDENNVKDYKTFVIRANDLYWEPLYQPVKNFVLINAPSSVDAAVPMIEKALPCVAAVVAGSVVLHKKCPSVSKAVWGSVAAAAMGYSAYSFIKNNKERKNILSELKK